MASRQAEVQSRIRVAAERVLAQTFGGPVRLGQPEGVWVYPDECRTTIQRALVQEGPPGVPATVIIKRINSIDPYDPNDLRLRGPAFYDATPAWRLITEWTATRFLSRFTFDPPLSPCCYGGDRAEGFVILEDLGTGERLYDLLHGSDPARAEAALLGYATALGRIHPAPGVGPRTRPPLGRRPVRRGAADLPNGAAAHAPDPGQLCRCH